jgi:WD40 repeat protein
MRNKQTIFARWRLHGRIIRWRNRVPGVGWVGLLAAAWPAALAAGTPDLLWSERGHSTRVNAVAFAPHGGVLASGGGDGLVHLWRVSNGTILRTLNLETPPDPLNRIISVAFSPDGTQIAGGGFGQIRVWSAANGSLLEHIENAHTDWVLSLAYSPEGSVLASGSFDGTARIWNREDWTLLHTLTHEAQVRSVAFSPDNLMLASGIGNGTVHLWQTLSGNLIRTLHTRTTPGHGGLPSADILSVSFSPDGDVLAAGSQDQTIKRWKLSNGQHLQTDSRHGHFVYSVVYSHDGKVLLSAGGDDTLRIWDADRGEPVWTYTGHTAGITTATLSSTDLFAFGRTDGRVLVGRLQDYVMKPKLLSAGDLRLRLHGEMDRIYVLQRSTNLIDWTAVSTNAMTERPLDFHSSPAGPATFFRVLKLPED